MKKAFLSAFLALLSVLAASAQGNILSVVGDSELFQFNMSGSGPPLSNIEVQVPYTLAGGAALLFQTFSDFNGTVPTGLSNLIVTSTQLRIDFTSPDADGLFSLRITLMQITSPPGILTLGTGTASALNAAGAPVTGRAVTVPEPATLAMIGLGLTGLALTRRRKSN